MVLVRTFSAESLFKRWHTQQKASVLLASLGPPFFPFPPPHSHLSPKTLPAHPDTPGRTIKCKTTAQSHPPFACPARYPPPSRSKEKSGLPTNEVSPNPSRRVPLFICFLAWLSWLNAAILIATFAVALFNASRDPIARAFAYVYAAFSVCVLVRLHPALSLYIPHNLSDLRLLPLSVSHHHDPQA